MTTDELDGKMPDEAENNFEDNFEDNFSIGEQPSAAVIEPDPMPKKAPAEKTVSVKPDAEKTTDEKKPPAANGAESRKLSPEEDLFRRFNLLHVPPNFCAYADLFRAYLKAHPDAPDQLETLLDGPESIAAVQLGLQRIQAFPPASFRNTFFYYPIGMMTEQEKKEWTAHQANRPQYESLAKGRYPYFDPPQFFYRHGMIYLDKAVTDRLEGGVFYECGAFCGASVIALHQYKPGLVYAFEPSKANMNFAKGNVARSGISMYGAIVQACTGEANGEVEMPDRDELGQQIKSKVPVLSLDKFAEQNKITGRTALIQADTAGAGLLTIRGAESMIRRDKPLISAAIYHNPEEFFEIAPLLHAWVPEYKFMVRRCQCNPNITYSEIILLAYIP